MRLLLVIVTVVLGTAGATGAAGAADTAGVTGVAGATMHAASASMQATEDREPGTFIEYTGTLTRLHQGVDESRLDDPVPATAGIQCDESGCELYGITVLGHGSGPYPVSGAEVTIELPGDPAACESEVTRPATVVVSATASAMSVVTTTPASGWMECGSGQRYHWGVTATFEGSFSSGDPCVLTGAVCPPEPEPVVEPESAETPPPAASRGPADPSVLATLRSPVEVEPTEALLAAALTVVLVVLVAFPTQLFNSVSDRASTALANWWRRIRRRRADAAAPVATAPGAAAPHATASDAAAPAPAKPFAGWVAAAAGVAAASLISAFVDPQFALDASSIRSFFSIFIALVLEVCVSWLVLIWLVRKTHPAATASFEFKPQSLLLVVAAVVFSRLSGFEPGIVFGLVAGVTFGAILATAARAKVALVGLGYSFVIAIGAWIAYGALAPSVAATDNFWLTFAHETLASLTIAGIAALPIALFPFRGLTGHTVFEWSRAAWAASYLVGLLAFFVVLLPFPSSWSGVSLSFATWIGLYLAYAAAAVLAWLLVTKPWRSPVDPAAPASPVAPTAPQA